MADVLVYTTERCPFCIRAKALLEARGVAYREINLERDPEGRTELVRKTGMMTFPQVLIDGELVGGFQETLAADRSGRLAELVRSAAWRLCEFSHAVSASCTLVRKRREAHAVSTFPDHQPRPTTTRDGQSSVLGPRVPGLGGSPRHPDRAPRPFQEVVHRMRTSRGERQRGARPWKAASQRCRRHIAARRDRIRAPRGGR